MRRFRDPRFYGGRDPSERFVWDYWHVPRQVRADSFSARSLHRFSIGPFAQFLKIQYNFAYSTRPCGGVFLASVLIYTHLKSHRTRRASR